MFLKISTEIHFYLLGSFDIPGNSSNLLRMRNSTLGELIVGLTLSEDDLWRASFLNQPEQGTRSWYVLSWTD